MRIRESRLRKKRFAEGARAEREQEFRDVCTFRPPNDAASRRWDYDAERVWRAGRREDDEAAFGPAMDAQSGRIAVGLEGAGAL